MWRTSYTTSAYDVKMGKNASPTSDSRHPTSHEKLPLVIQINNSMEFSQCIHEKCMQHFTLFRSLGILSSMPVAEPKSTRSSIHKNEILEIEMVNALFYVFPRRFADKCGMPSHRDRKLTHTNTHQQQKGERGLGGREIRSQNLW